MVTITFPTTIPQNSVNYSCSHVFTILLFVINALILSYIYKSRHLENSEYHKSITSQTVAFLYYVQLLFIKYSGSLAAKFHNGNTLIKWQ